MAPKKTPDAPDISGLSIGDNKGRNKKTAPVVDSWEDDLESSGDEKPQPDIKAEPDLEEEPDASSSKPEPSSGPKDSEVWNPYGHQGPSDYDDNRSSSKAPERRPEKSTAAVSRMLAGSLGIRVKRTAEQREFDRAQIANEKKRREAEKAKKEEEERQKRSVWED